ncbi:MAG: hypothetical protein WED06_02600 [Candidatus Paceibacterota bacterium]
MADVKPILRKDNTTSPIIMIAIVVLGLIVGVFYYIQVLRDSVVDVLPPNIPPNDKLVQFNTLQLDFSIFDNERFQSLKIFGESPVRPDTTGKSNLFSAF